LWTAFDGDNFPAFSWREHETRQTMLAIHKNGNARILRCRILPLYRQPKSSGRCLLLGDPCGIEIDGLALRINRISWLTPSEGLSPCHSIEHRSAQGRSGHLDTQHRPGRWQWRERTVAPTSPTPSCRRDRMVPMSPQSAS